jgi:hypothetical protein
MGRKAPLRCSVRLHRRLLRPFSDSFGREILRNLHTASCLEHHLKTVRLNP